MLQPRISPLTVSQPTHSLSGLTSALTNLTVSSRLPSCRPQLHVRHASHAAQGRANGPGDSAGRRLGAKKTASQYVIPGNIIFKQRGTKWFPGENVGIGKDHTIYSTVYGYVRYYRNPAVHPKRKYIGVALEKEGQGSQLPSPPNAPTRRRLGMHAAPIKEADSAFLEEHAAASSLGGSESAEGKAPIPVPAATKVSILDLARRSDGLGVANFEIGRAAERKGVSVREFDRKDRWLAWRIRARKVKQKIAVRQSKKTSKNKGPKKTKKIPIGVNV